MLFLIKSRHACRHCGMKSYEARVPAAAPWGATSVVVACDGCGMPPTKAALDAMEGVIAETLAAALYQSEG